MARQPNYKPCSLDLAPVKLHYEKLILYAGNMGIAQNVKVFLELASYYKNSSKLGFVFVGRGSEVKNLKDFASANFLNNVFFFDEIHPDEIPELCAQCDLGIVALSSKHKSHNIPGKFLTYMQSGLPCIANLNRDNDLVELIKSNKIGQVCDTNSLKDLSTALETLLKQIDSDTELSLRCKIVFQEKFSAQKAVITIINQLASTN